MHVEIIKVVINIQGDQLKAKFRQVLSNLDGGSRFTTRGWTCHKDHANFITPIEDHVGSIFNIFMIGSLSRGHNLVQAVVANGLVE